MVWSRIGGKGPCNIPTAYSCLHLQEFLLLGSKACIGKIFFSNECHLYSCCECALVSRDRTRVI